MSMSLADKACEPDWARYVPTYLVVPLVRSVGTLGQHGRPQHGRTLQGGPLWWLVLPWYGPSLAPCTTATAGTHASYVPYRASRTRRKAHPDRVVEHVRNAECPRYIRSTDSKDSYTLSSFQGGGSKRARIYVQADACMYMRHRITPYERVDGYITCTYVCTWYERPFVFLQFTASPP